MKPGHATDCVRWAHNRSLFANLPIQPGRGNRYRRLPTTSENARRHLLAWDILDDMHTRILRRVGVVLLAAGTIGAVASLTAAATHGPYPIVLDLTPIVSGVFLLRGGLRAALWVRMLAVFLLTAAVAALVAMALIQPLDLTVTEIRLDPVDFVVKAAATTGALGVSLWVAVKLGRREVQDAIAGAGIKRWDMRIPAQAGGGLVALAGLLLWLALHGQSAELATSLALQQLGPDYRYCLSSIRSTGNGHGTSVTGVVTAWNDKEIKQVVLHWETR